MRGADYPVEVMAHSSVALCWLILVVAASTSCAAETAAGGTGATDAGPPDPDAPRVCREMANAVADEIVRKCANQSKQSTVDSFVAQAQCDRVTNIRNIVELRHDCIAVDLPNLTCAQLASGRLTTACAGQLIRPR